MPYRWAGHEQADPDPAVTMNGDSHASGGRPPPRPWRLVPLALIALGLVLFVAFDLDSYLSFDLLRRHREALVAWTRDNQALALAAYVLVYAVAVTLSLPGGTVLTLAGGFLFGTAAGAASAVIGATAGATTLFLAVRLGLGDLLRARAGPAIRRMEAGFRENALSYLLVLRLVPLFPFWLVNLVPAFLGVPLATYVAGTFIGIIPATAVFAGIGSGLGALLDAGREPDLGVVFTPGVLLPLVGLALLALLPIVYKRVKARQG